MKILTFISSLDQRDGGPSRSVPLLVKGLAQKGIDITLMTIESDNLNIRAIEGTSARIKILKPNVTRKELETIIISEGFDLIQLQSIWDFKYHIIAKIARKHNIPYLITPRGMLEPWSLNQKKWKKKIALWLYQMRDLRKAACIYTTAKMEAKHIRELNINVPIAIIPNGIETDEYPRRTSISEVKKQVLFLSRIHIKKGIELLFEAWLKIQKCHKDWHLTIVGNGDEPYIQSLQEMIIAKNLSNTVEILPPAFGKAKVKLYQESSIFCLPSYSENFGMVIAEAMSCGVPVITTNGTPWQELNDLGLGWCIDLNVDNLAKTLSEAIDLGLDSLFNKGQQCSKHISNTYHYTEVSAKNKVLYEWILGIGEKPYYVV